MSAEETDTELRDLVAQTLEANGTLGKLRAQLRASVFLALEEQESVQNRTPFLNKELKSFLSTEDGHMVTSLVREFLEFFHLEFTTAVFDPETGLNDERDSRSELSDKLGLAPGPGAGESGAPVLLEVLRRCRSGDSALSSPPNPSNGTSSAVLRNEDVASLLSNAFPKELTERQVEEARKKFEEYDRDGSGGIDKDELRELFMDMFPAFNKNMLERYVNDEFRAVDRDFSSSIDFDEFLGMYKRLFLQCRTVVSGDVEELLSSPPRRKTDSLSSGASAKSGPSFNSVEAKNQRNLEKSAPPPLPSTPPPMRKANQNGSSVSSVDDVLGADDDSFFDDLLPSGGGGLQPFGNSPSPKHRAQSPRAQSPRAQSPNSKNRPSQIPVFGSLRSDSDKKKDEGKGVDAGPKGGGAGKGAGGNSMSSLGDLPSFLNSGGLTSAPPATNSKQPPAVAPKPKEGDQNLRSLDRRMADLGIGNDMQDDYEYEDDFQSSGHSLSLKSPRSKTEGRDKTENGSIAEEIEDEEIEDISIEADELLKSENSGFDDMTEDRSISQMDGGFDYMEDPQLP